MALWLISQGADVTEWVNGTSLTMLSLAAGFCSATVVRKVVDILREKVGKAGDIFAPSDDTLILNRAIAREDAESVHMLLENGADPSGWDIHGVSALTLATANGDEEIVTMLLDRGANPLPHDAVGRSALSCAAVSTTLSWQTVERIFHAYRDAGGDINCTYVTIPEFVGGAPRPLERLPLHDFSAAGSVPGVELLLRYGADVSIKGRNGMTALHAALFSYRYNRNTYQKINQICQLLIEATVRLGGDLNSGMTPYASFMPMRGATALHLAVICELEEVVRLLLENGANMTTADEDGKTALDLAQGSNHQLIVDLLTAYGGLGSVALPNGVGIPCQPSCRDELNGSTTSFVSDCPSSATATITASASTSTNDLGCDVTLVSGPRTYWAEYHGETYERCDVGSKTATCYQTVTTTSGSVTLGVSVDSSQVPVTSVAFTVVGTDASATPSDSASASTKTSSGGAAGTTSASATGGANASNTENAALGLPTGHGYVAAGGAVMALALAIA
ncbi:ankyrin repeat-containing domain protein [Aspergillus bertholletiae]|uniref:Ankyrin repeat-containing domain protein n=1 Tax=Aspergillus bertholletiae TaxID=1226010 RepID=A0A5N7BPT4_9EURO|nr:ankyrin repeat-containing domain protein [Aspergillus bertholletiae]